MYIILSHYRGLNLSPLVPPKIQRGPRVLKAQAGQRVDILCSAQGIPPPAIAWFRARGAVPTGDGQFSHSPDGALSISNVQPPDAGVYKCVASNVAGSDTSEITLQVQGIYVGAVTLSPGLAICNIMLVFSDLCFGGQCSLLLFVT